MMSPRALLPQELREPCEALMASVQEYHQSRMADAKPCVFALAALNSRVESSSPALLEDWIEYVSIPMLLLLPTDAAKSALVNERIREECFRGLAILVRKLPQVFAARRVDLFSPVLLRVLASLTDMDSNGQVMRSLKEETKTRALELLLELFQCGSTTASTTTNDNTSNSLTLHCTALLLDLSNRFREKSPEIRILALDVFRALIQNRELTSREDVEFMLPGASSALCEASQMDFKSRQQVAVVALRTLLALCEAVGDLTPVMGNLFPRLARIWKDSGQEAGWQVKLARTCLAAYVLLNSRRRRRQSEETTEDDAAGLDKEAALVLVRHVLIACAEMSAEDDEARRGILSAYESISHLCDAASVLCDSLCVRLQDHTLTPAELHQEVALSRFLLRQQQSSTSASVSLQLDLAFDELYWSVLFALSCDASRAEQSGKVEFFRVLDLPQASLLLRELMAAVPDVGMRLYDALLQGVDNALSDAARFGDDGEVLRLPPSSLPTAIFILSQLAANSTTTSASPRQLLLCLLDMDALWYGTGQADDDYDDQHHRSLLTAQVNDDALVKIAALDAVAECASAVPLLLVDALYPVLHALGDEHTGVRIAAERCLEAMARECGHVSVTDLLQGNVDYVVDALVRRLPQLHPGDVRFANVIHALVQRIPVWVSSSTTADDATSTSSPWVDDLIFTLLQGLDNRANSPQVVWCLLRIAQVIVSRASEASVFAPVVPTGDSAPPLVFPRLKAHDAYVDECVEELTAWTAPAKKTTTAKTGGGGARIRPMHDDDDDDEANNSSSDSEDDDNDDAVTKRRNADDDDDATSLAAMGPFESVLDKCLLFFSDYDLLVRHQAFKVAAACVDAIGLRSQSRARQAVYRMWPSMIEQLQEERNAEITTLLLDSLLVASSAAAGEDFFAAKFGEEAWPVLESVLHRARIKTTRTAHQQRPFRDLQLAKRVLQVLPRLPPSMLAGAQAQRIAHASSLFFGDAELHRDAVQVWHALAERGAGDYIWLAVAAAAVASGKEHHNMHHGFTHLPDDDSANQLWDVLQAQ